MSEIKPVLRLEGIVKTFPGVRALDGVNFDVRPGEVHALMGENGAGKSTLMKVLAGVYQPDGGKIIIDDKPVKMTNPIEAKEHGVILIHQELSLAEEMTVAENVFLGELPRTRWGFVDWSVLDERVGTILKKLNCDFGPRTRIGTLSIAKKQMCEIARALTHHAKVVVFDEPTASLTDAEKVVLFDVIRDLQSEGVGLVYISHRMEEIFKITDRISILRDGSYRGTLITKETNEEEVTQAMIGRKLDLSRHETTHETRRRDARGAGPQLRQALPGRELCRARGRGARLLRPRWGRPDRDRRDAVRPAPSDRRRRYSSPEKRPRSRRRSTQSVSASPWSPRAARNRGSCSA